MNSELLKTALKYGGIAGVIIIILSKIEDKNSILFIVSVIIYKGTLLTCMGLSHRDFLKKNNLTISLKETIVSGILVLTVAGLLSSVYMSVVSGFSVIGILKQSIIFILANSIVLIFLILIESQWRIYVKAGKKGWASLIPIYNTLELLDIVQKPKWWLLLLLVPGVNIVILVWVVNLLGKRFGKDEYFTVGLLLLPFVFYPLLGFGNQEYNDDKLLNKVIL